MTDQTKLKEGARRLLASWDAATYDRAGFAFNNHQLIKATLAELVREPEGRIDDMLTQYGIEVGAPYLEDKPYVHELTNQGFASIEDWLAEEPLRIGERVVKRVHTDAGWGQWEAA